VFRQFPWKSKNYNVALLKVLTLTISVRKNNEACSEHCVREPSVLVAGMCRNYMLKNFDKFLTYYIFTCNLSFTASPSFLVSVEVGSEFWDCACNTLYVQKLSGQYISPSLNYACMASRIVLNVTFSKYPTCSRKKKPSHRSAVFIATFYGQNSEFYTQ